MKEQAWQIEAIKEGVEQADAENFASIEKIAEAIEGAVPFQFDRPLPGLPAAVFGVDDNDHIIVCLDNGRAVRHCLGDFPERLRE